LDQIFSLDANRLGLVVAAVFGLSPSLLLQSLERMAERYRAELRSTSDTA
jgi:hypothetical protein